MPSPSLALIGCGAIAESFYLPALAKRADLVSSLTLVDRDLDRAQKICRDLGAKHAVTDFREVTEGLDGAIVATPHHLHHPMTMELVKEGIHVLCEKPLAATRAEVDEIIEAADASGVQVAVNHTRRLFTSFQEVQRLVASGAIGQLEHIEYVLGEPFGWPAETNTYFGPAAGGKGVLFDTGAHIVDLVCWFMGGEPELVQYLDDARGGTEAVADVSLRLGDATAHVRLSWLSKLQNTYRIEGSQGALEGRVYEWSSYTHEDSSGKSRSVKTDRVREFPHFADKLVHNFTEVMAGNAKPTVSPRDIRSSVSLIETCYENRTAMDTPWLEAHGRLAHAQ